MTLCSLYLPPSTTVDAKSLGDLIVQLPPPVMIMGDFNAHNPLWGGGTLDIRGKIVEDFVNNINLCILNSNTPTYIHPAAGTHTFIDITICDTNLFADVSWRVHDDLSGSDHFPIIVQFYKASPPACVPRWKMSKADWSTFHDKCSEKLNTRDFTVKDDPISAFTTNLVEIAELTVPRTKQNNRRINKPWFNDSCREAVANRKRVVRSF